MDGTPQMQDAICGDVHGWTVCRKSRTQFVAMSMDGRYAANAGRNLWRGHCQFNVAAALKNRQNRAPAVLVLQLF
jgi:hypothetical protein